MTDVLWLCATGNHPVGIVKLYDEIEQRWKYYIGTGDGNDPTADVQMILAKGQKSYSLDHILDFLEEDVEKVVRCKDCKYGMKSHLQPPYEKRTHLCRHSWEGEYHEPDHFCAYGERRDDHGC